jgi:hypothetical protein
MSDRFNCPHCQADLEQLAIATERWKIECSHCQAPVAIWYEQERNGRWYYHLEETK